jgi:Na+-transporting NADH:ubiquinone oxidoreductase subunit NqrE
MTDLVKWLYMARKHICPFFFMLDFSDLCVSASGMNYLINCKHCIHCSASTRHNMASCKCMGVVLLVKVTIFVHSLIKSNSCLRMALFLTVDLCRLNCTSPFQVNWKIIYQIVIILTFLIEKYKMYVNNCFICYINLMSQPLLYW